MLEIKNLSKSFGSKKAVSDLSLELENGKILGFIGHNGAGKTTTIRMIVGALIPDSGEIVIGGINLKKDPIACKKIMAYIPDNPNLYEHLTGIQYLNFIANIFQIDKSTREERIKKTAERFGIEKNLGDLISSYSHGMKQKLALTSAFIHQPKLLVLDEPFVGLDPKASHELKAMMKELCKEGSAIFFSTHVLEVAEKLCDEVAIIKDGKLITSGSMKKILKDKSLEELFMEQEK